MRLPRSLIVLVGSLMLGCGGGGSQEDGGAPTDAGTQIDGGDSDGGSFDAGEPGPRRFGLSDLLAPVTPAELDAVAADWSTRDLGAHDVEIVASGSVTFGTVTMNYRVLSHLVEGQRHYGAVLVPAGLTGPAPVLIYAHGGFTGDAGLPPFSVEELQFRIPGQPLRSQMVYVVPSYRGERIRMANVDYASEGFTVIGDTDLTDTAALLTAVFETTPQADPNRVAIMGESRGGMVALSLGARDARMKLVIDAFGTTDFRIAMAAVPPDVFEAVVGSAAQHPEDPANLLVRSLIPLSEVSFAADGGLQLTDKGYDEMRMHMASTSALASVNLLPPTQVHHGTADTTASVEYSRSLAAAMADAGRVSPSDSFTYFEYDGGGHDLTTLPGAVGRMADAINHEFNP